MLKYWTDELIEATNQSKVLCIAVFDKLHNLIYVNHGMKNLFHTDNAAENFNTPSLENIFALSKAGYSETLINIGNYDNINTTIYARVWQKNNQILIAGEIDATMISKTNISLSKLISENSNLQRSLIKEKKMLEIANKKLAQLNQDQNIILGTAAHDLRSPISTAFSLAELLTENSDIYSNDEIIQYLKIIKNTTELSINLLDSLLDFSAIESGKVDLNIKSDNYCKIIEQVIEANTIFAKNKNIEIAFKIEDNICNISLDKTRISQLLTNLLSNAIKYSYPHTQIIIKVNKTDKWIVTHVIDHGQGIKQDELKNLFKTFSKTSSKPTGGEKSTGLGLAIVKKIIDLHKGKIEVESTIKKGSTFTFYLPIH